MPSADDCLFCGIVAGTVPAQIVDSDEHTVAFIDISPATRGHALVVPREHSADLFEISDEDLERTMVAARRLARRMDEVLEPDGFNLLNSCRPAAWQTVFHFHVHVVPRYEDDPLHLPWVPREGDKEEIAAIAARVRSDGEGGDG
jgi:histidine triad (HIT) family protein